MQWFHAPFRKGKKSLPVKSWHSCFITDEKMNPDSGRLKYSKHMWESIKYVFMSIASFFDERQSNSENDVWIWAALRTFSLKTVDTKDWISLCWFTWGFMEEWYEKKYKLCSTYSLCCLSNWAYANASVFSI